MQPTPAPNPTPTANPTPMPPPAPPGSMTTVAGPATNVTATTDASKIGAALALVGAVVVALL